MENIINVKCYDLNLSKNKKEGVCAEFICYDLENNKMLTITTSINNQINQIYKNIKINKIFLERLEYKLKLTFRLNPSELIFEICQGKYFLITPFKDIYKPVILSYDGVKIGFEGLFIDVKLMKIVLDKTNVFIECLVKEVDYESNYFIEKIKKINITNEFDCIYKDNEIKKNFQNKRNVKIKNKQIFAHELSSYLEDKILSIEYDEYKGYSLWTVLETFFDYDNCI